MNTPKPSIKLFLICVILLTSPACNKRKCCTIPTAEYFPNSENTSWKYKVYTGANSNLVNVTVGKRGATGNMWVVDYAFASPNLNSIPDTLFVSTTGRRVQIIRNEKVNTLNFQFPIYLYDSTIYRAGSYNQFNPYSDSSNVVSNAKVITTEGVTYSNCLVIVSRIEARDRTMCALCGYYKEVDTTWFKPYYGIVKVVQTVSTPLPPRGIKTGFFKTVASGTQFRELSKSVWELSTGKSGVTYD